MRPPIGSSGGGRQGPLRDFLYFDRLLTGQMVHLVYWAGLGVAAVVALGVIGMSFGLATGAGWQGVLAALPVLVIGLLAVGVGALLWRSFCEFYLTIFRISEDLRALRLAQEAQAAAPPPSAPPGETQSPAAPQFQPRRYF